MSQALSRKERDRLLLAEEDRLDAQWEAEHGDSVASETSTPPSPWALWTVMALLLVVCILGFHGASSAKIGSIGKPQAGLWLLIISSQIAVCGVAVLVELLRKKPAQRNPGSRESQHLMNVGIIVLSLVFLVGAYHLLGFVIPAVIAMWCVTRYACKETLAVSAALAVITPLVVYAMFGVAFQVSIDPLPGCLN